MRLSQPARRKALARLAELKVADVDPAVADSYERSEFGWGWYDFDKDGQNARAEMLILYCQQPDKTLAFATDDERRVVGGRWRCRFTGNTYTDAGELDIDHIVPLKNAWISGAHAWTDERRRAYASGQGIRTKRRSWLVPVDASANRSKADKSPDAWLPERVQYLPRYAALWVVTKHYWQLSVTPAEQAQLHELLTE